MRLPFARFSMLACGYIWWVVGALAADYTVSNLSDSGPGSLREAITTANGAGSPKQIEVALGGSIDLLSSLPQITGNIMIRVSAPDAVVINGQGRQIVSVGAEGTLALEGLTLSSGVGLRGGAVENNGTLAATNCVFTSNSSTNWYSQYDPRPPGGGAIWNGASVVLSTCRFEGNYCQPFIGLPMRGGAILTTNGLMHLQNCSFIGNRTAFAEWDMSYSGGGSGADAFGGAIFVASGSNTVEACSFVANFVRAETAVGDADFIRGGGGGNGGSGSGGAIYLEAGGLRMTNCTFAANYVRAGDAGASPRTPRNAGRGGDARGGAICLIEGGRVVNCTFAFNSVTNGLGVHNLVVGYNSDGSPSYLTTPDGSIIGNATSGGSLGNCLFAGNMPTAVDFREGGVANLVVPADTLNPLADNGGPTLTHMLKPNCDAINGGDAASAPALDQRGVSRPKFGKVDIGAVEMDALDVPGFVSYPSDQHLLLTTNVIFSVVLNAPHNTEVTWYKDGQVLAKGTNWNFPIDSVQRSTAGKYWVVARNDAGETSTPQFTVVVDELPPPDLVSFTPSQHLYVTTNLTLSAEFGGRVSAIKWYKEQQFVAAGATLQIVNAQPGDAGNYTAVAENESATTSTPNIDIEVDTGPFIFARSNRPLPNEGEAVTLQASIFARKPYSLQWFRNAVPLPPTVDQPTYLIPALSEGTRGSYTVRVKNGDGQATSTPVVIEFMPALLVTNLADYGAGSLRNGIERANAISDATFRTILITVPGIIHLASPLPVISNSVHVIGLDARQTELNGSAQFPLLAFGGNSSSTVIHLTLSGGMTAMKGHGGAILNQGMLSISNCVFRGNTSRGGFGGAIYSANSISIRNCAFEGNSALGEGVAYAGSGAGFGGAVFLAGQGATIGNCTFANNQAIGGSSILNVATAVNQDGFPGGGPGGLGSGGDAGKSQYVYDRDAHGFLYWMGWVGKPGDPGQFGGGGGCGGYGQYLYRDPGVPGGLGGYGGGDGAASRGAWPEDTHTNQLGLYSSGGGGAGMGAAIFAQYGNVEIRNCTMIRNTAKGGTAGQGAGAGKGIAGGIFNYQANVLIQNSVIAQNIAEQNADSEGSITSGGFNLFGQQSGITPLASDLSGLDPLLSATASAGTEIPGYAPLAGSPLIDHGHSDLAEDQRGHPRQADDPDAANGAGSDLSDIGAYEVDTALKIVSLAVNGSHVELKFNSMASQKYQLRYKAEITGPWVTMRPVWSGTGDWVTVSFDLAEPTGRFFQVARVL